MEIRSFQTLAQLFRRWRHCSAAFQHHADAEIHVERVQEKTNRINKGTKN